MSHKTQADERNVFYYKLRLRECMMCNMAQKQDASSAFLFLDHTALVYSPMALNSLYSDDGAF
jgi:hypothetical protein